MPAAALLGGVGRAGMNSLQLSGEEGANTFFRETGTKQARINSSSHSKHQRASTVVLEYPGHRYGMALCFLGAGACCVKTAYGTFFSAY